MSKHTPEERIMQDACGASLPAAINEDATEAAVARINFQDAVDANAGNPRVTHAEHLDHFMRRVQTCPGADALLAEKMAELNHEAAIDEQHARREEAELRQWEQDKGGRTP